MLRRSFVVVLALGLMWTAPRTANAQSSSEVAAARRLFLNGLQAARDGDWPAARGHFERSYAIAPRSNTLLNLAGAQTQTGQLVSAAESYRRFIAEAEGRAARHRPRAEAALAEITPRLSHLFIGVEGIAEGDLVQLGERELSHAVLGIDLPVDPGEHTVVVSRGGEEVARGTITLAEGGTETLRVEVVAAATEHVPGSVELPATERDSSAPAAAFEVSTDDGGGDGVLIGVIVGVVVAVIAGAVITTVLVLDTPSAHQGSLGDGVLEFD